MKLLNPFMFRYLNRDNDENIFVIDPEKSLKKGVDTYNHFINGLWIGNSYSITEIHPLMDNGYEWKVF